MLYVTGHYYEKKGIKSEKYVYIIGHVKKESKKIRQQEKWRERGGEEERAAKETSCKIINK